jgi:hypothetical protein
LLHLVAALLAVAVLIPRAQTARADTISFGATIDLQIKNESRR